MRTSCPIDAPKLRNRKTKILLNGISPDLKKSILVKYHSMTFIGEAPILKSFLSNAFLS